MISLALTRLGAGAGGADKPLLDRYSGAPTVGQHCLGAVTATRDLNPPLLNQRMSASRRK